MNLKYLYNQIFSSTTKLTIFIIIIIPLLFYLFNFKYGLSESPSDWAAFGSYVGGIYGALAFFAIIYSTYLTRNQFITQHEDEMFYKSVESFTFNTLVASKESQGNYSQLSVAKAVVLEIQKELENQAPHMARKILCESPDLISETNISKIVNSINSIKNTIEKDFNDRELLEEINKRQSLDSKWEYLKYILDGVDDEDNIVRKALMDAGSTSFYLTDFCHRQHYYKLAWQSAEGKHSEELNIYLRRFDFILYHIEKSKLKDKYKKYFYSQISKYDCIVLYYYALTSHNFDTVRLLLDTDILEKEIKRDESTTLLFDFPSKEQVATELQFIKEKLVY